MYKTVLLLTALALVQARPNDDAEVTNAPYEVHKDCPPAEVHFLIPHEYDCTKFYYCEYGLRFTEPINCAPGTEFNAEKQVCTHAWASNCTLSGFPTTSPPVANGTEAPTTVTPEDTPAPEVTPVPEVNVQPVAVLGPPVPFSSPNADDCETLDNGCPVDFTIHKVIPHEEYCHLFYFCDKGERVLWACPEPLYFDPEAQVCVWSWQTDCVNNGSYTYPTAAAPETETTSTTAPGDFDLGDVLDNGCPADIHIHHLLPHEECEKFYQCNFGQKVERDCAPGTVFHFEIQVCDWPRNVRGCEGSPGATARPPTTPEVTTPNDPEDWVALPNGCPANSSIHHLLPHESECDRYYVCDNGRLVEMGCPTATHFSPSLQQCTWPHEAGCEHWTGGCGSTPDNNGSSCGGSSTAADVISTTPVSNISTTPVSNISTTPVSNISTTPVSNISTTPVSNISTTPVSIISTTPVSDISTTPSNVTDDESITTTQSAPCTGCPTAYPGTTPAGLPDSSEEITLPSDPELPGESTYGTTTAAEPPCDTEGSIVDPVSTPAPDSGNGTTVPTDPELPGESTNGTTTEEPPCDTEGSIVDPVSTLAPDSGNETTLPTDPELPGESTNGTTTEEPPCDTEGSTVDPGTTPAGLPDSSEEISLPSDPDLPGESTDATTATPGCPQCPPLPVNPEDRCKQDCNVAPWAHPECDKYYSCIGNELRLNICSEGLHFNPSKLTCDFICNAGCIRNIPQVTRHPDGLLMFVPNSFNNKANMMQLIEHELNGDL